MTRKNISRKIVPVLLAGLMLVSTGVNIFAHEEEQTGGSSTTTVSVTLTFGTYELQKTEQGDELSLEDFGSLLVPGKPDLPSRIYSIAIPPGASVVDVDYETNDYEILPESYAIQPVNLPRVIGNENPDIYAQEKATYETNHDQVYGSDEPYPTSIVEFVQSSHYRKYNLVDVRVTPFTYTPLSGQLIYYPEIIVHVNYALPEQSEDVMVDNLARTENIAKEIIINYNQAQAWYPYQTTNTLGLHDYVIITLPSLTSSVTSLVNWETMKGRTVQVVNTTWIYATYTGYDNAAKIRNFLREKYPSSQWGIEDVLLVGHYDNVPMRRCAQDTGYGQPETDYYYAELSLPDSSSWDLDNDHLWGENSDPIDFLAEINVGRIPTSSVSLVQSICQKSVAFEQNYDTTYKKNILLLGAYFWDDTDNAVLMEYKTNPTIHPWMSSWTKTKMYEDAQSSYPCNYDLLYSNVQSVWSAGKYSFVNWAGHGSPDAAYELYYPNGDWFVNTATCNSLNDNYPSIVFADSCSNSDTDYFNIGQAMLQRGAVGFLGATKVAYGMGAWNHPSDGSTQTFDYYFTTKVTSGDYTQGAAHQSALRQMYTTGGWYYVKYEMFEWGAFWGNPDLGMSAAPGEISVTPSSFSLTVPMSETVNDTLTISNDAAALGPLVFQTSVPIDLIHGVWLTVSPSSGIINAGDTLDLTVTVNAANLPPGTYGSSIKITSNDLDEHEIIVPLTATVTSNTPNVTIGIWSSMIQVPRNSNFVYWVTITNNDPVSYTVKVWTAAQKLPSGSMMEPLKGPVTTTLNPGQTKTYANIPQYIGAGVPLGTYRYYARVGENCPTPLWNDDYWDFEVVP